MSESFIDLKCNKSCRHIRELEQQLSELKKSQKQKQIIRLCNRLDKAEQQNKQMIEALEYYLIYNKNSLNSGLVFTKIKNCYEAVTDKSIDELLK